MHHHIFSSTQQAEYPIVILTPTINSAELTKHIVKSFDIEPDVVVALTLHQSQGKKKTPVKEIKEYVNSELVDALNDVSASYIICMDAEYFKVLAGVPKADANIGYVLDSPFGPWKVVYVPNIKTRFYSPQDYDLKAEQSVNALKAHAEGTYVEPGTGILHSSQYPKTYLEIQLALANLQAMDCDLSADIEAFSLKHFSAGIGSISFAWDKNNGIAFPVDYEPSDEVEGLYGKQVRNEPVRELLRAFFKNHTKKMIYHNITFDVTVLIYQLFMENIIDTSGLLDGLDILMKNWECTKLITYLATNSCGGNELGLKDQSQEFAGNYAEDEIKDIRKIKLDDLLEYNLVDTCATWFTYEKQNPVMLQDQQEEVYEKIFKPAAIDIVHMQLTGMPVNMETVKKNKKILQKDHDDALDIIMNSDFVEEFTYNRMLAWVEKRNSELKKKQVTFKDAEILLDLELKGKRKDLVILFNPNSGPQMSGLLFKQIGLPILETTKTGLPATDGDTLKDLLNHTTEPKVLELLKAFQAFSAVDKILTSFIPALENAQQGPDKWHYLFGNFNLGGTVSGRLSSNNPNLQNLPATGSKYAALIKECFEAPPGWLFTGLDFESLEDRISAVTTKDPNKIKVYTDGYDGHCLRAFAYFPEKLKGIINTVESINSIKKVYDEYRQLSKTPTFALTYQGTWMTLVRKCGFTQAEAKKVEKGYHDLYAVSDAWVQGELDKASKCGYIVGAFGLRVRTPMLKQVIRGSYRTPAMAEAEGRTAGNALGQSWCLLNSRAGSEFLDKVRSSKHRLDIRPCAQIHDAQYYLIREDLAPVMFTNEHLVKAVQWNDHPAIYHPQVGFGGKLTIFHPNWANEITIPNGVTEEALVEIVNEGFQ